jgi:hypothetical protein
MENDILHRLNRIEDKLDRLQAFESRISLLEWQVATQSKRWIRLLDVGYRIVIGVLVGYVLLRLHVPTN